MRFMRFLVIALMAALATPAGADAIRTKPVHFAAGTSGATIKDRIKGRDSVSYTLSANAGQRMIVKLKSANASAYFNVYAPGRGPGDEALAISELEGPMVPEMNTFSGVLPASGVYTINVYLYRNAARRGETAAYTLDIQIPPGGGAEPTANDAKVAGTNFNATGMVPCARAKGQPMGQCKFGVERQGQGKAVVTVFWPDGGSRAIFFEQGRPAFFDQSQADGDVKMQVGQEADLWTIRIGDQRIEIPSAVVDGG
ncbi:MAG: hypothetical protein U1E46_11065 [Hyphomicrobiales bacterium]